MISSIVRKWRKGSSEKVYWSTQMQSACHNLTFWHYYINLVSDIPYEHQHRLLSVNYLQKHFLIGTGCKNDITTNLNANIYNPSLPSHDFFICFFLLLMLMLFCACIANNMDQDQTAPLGSASMIIRIHSLMFRRIPSECLIVWVQIRLDNPNCLRRLSGYKSWHKWERVKKNLYTQASW